MDKKKRNSHKLGSGSMARALGNMLKLSYGPDNLIEGSSMVSP
jgi:hypothetical protein